MEADSIIKDLIKAWESLKGNESHSPKAIEDWLREQMSPAINKARAYIKKVGNN